MTDEKWNDIEKLLSEFDARLSRKLSAAEKLLLEELIDAVRTKANFSGGRLSDGQDLTSIVDEVHRMFYRNGEGRAILEFIIESIIQSSTLNFLYYSPEAPRGLNIEKLQQDIQSKIFKSIGLEKTSKGFKVISGGYLESMVSSPEVLKAVKREMVNSVFGKKDFRELKKGLKIIIEGTDQTEGILRRHYKTFAYDTLQQANRVEAQVFAGAIGLQAFQYAGNVIDTTRCFCNEHVKKIILKEDAESQWPDTIGDKCGVIWSDNLPEYQPTKDMGGINCRHQPRWISNAQAMRLDPTIKYKNGKLYRQA